MNRSITVTLLAGLLLAPTAAHAEEPVQAITSPSVEEPVQAVTSPSALDVAITDAGYTRSGGAYTTNTVPFARLTNGQTFVGDDADHLYTRTWIPWSGEVVLVNAYSHTVTGSAPAPGVLHVRGGILGKYLGTGGEDRHGRATTNEYAGSAGTHAAATPTATQRFQTPGGRNTEIVWTSPYGAHPVTGGILSAWKAHGGANTQGAPTSDEHTVWVNGVQYQQQHFERGTFRWSAKTGAFRA